MLFACLLRTVHSQLQNARMKLHCREFVYIYVRVVLEVVYNYRIVVRLCDAVVGECSQSLVTKRFNR